jgi:iron complex transport system permease protein
MALTPARGSAAAGGVPDGDGNLTIGPLSFVGLMAPHIARMMGFRRTMPHIVMSA